jgi:hypothetical protein
VSTFVGEHARLRDLTRAGLFLDSTGYRGLGDTAAGIARRLATLDLVDEAVADMSTQTLADVTRLCSTWRDNGVADLLHGKATGFAIQDSGSGERIRTSDQVINSHPLYH